MVLSPIRSIRKQEDTSLNGVIFILSNFRMLSHEDFLPVINISRNSWCFKSVMFFFIPNKQQQISKCFVNQSFFNHPSLILASGLAPSNESKSINLPWTSKIFLFSHTSNQKSRYSLGIWRGAHNSSSGFTYSFVLSMPNEWKEAIIIYNAFLYTFYDSCHFNRCS